MGYGLKNNYSIGVPVSPSDLNRRADILSAQLPGAVGLLGVGVVGPNDLLISGTGTGTNVAPGQAVIESADGTPVYVRVPSALPVPARGAGENYLHLALRVPLTIGNTSDTQGTDTLRGAAPVLLLSADDIETDALRLANWNGASWTDARVFTLMGALRLAVSDLGYDAAARVKGTVNARLDALTTPVAAGSSGSFASLQSQVNALKAALDTQATQIAVLQGKIGTPGLESAVDDINRYEVRELARHGVELTKLDAHFSTLTDDSIFVPGTAGNGEDLGNGLSARDVHSGNTALDLDGGSES